MTYKYLLTYLEAQIDHKYFGITSIDIDKIIQEHKLVPGPIDDLTILDSVELEMKIVDKLSKVKTLLKRSL